MNMSPPRALCTVCSCYIPVNFLRTEGAGVDGEYFPINLTGFFPIYNSFPIILNNYTHDRFVCARGPLKS